MLTPASFPPPLLLSLPPPMNVRFQSLTEEEQKLFRLYGKLPTRKDVVGNKLKVGSLAGRR